MDLTKFSSWSNVRSTYFRKVIVRKKVKGAQELELGEKPGRGVGNSFVLVSEGGGRMRSLARGNEGEKEG